MMAGNPSWWSMVPPSQQPSAWLSSSSPPFFPSQYVVGSSSLPLNPLPENQELPQSWSQLLFGGLPGDEDNRFGLSHHQSKKLENWEDQILNPSLRVPTVAADVKQEVSQNSNNLYGHRVDEYNFQAPRPPWSQVLPVSSPRSCVTSSSSNILDFSYTKAEGKMQHPPDQSSECNSTAAGGMCKKARLQPSSSQPPLKVRKEKLGDRITALHQLVSPFGKTDTASVLLEGIGYIRFLQGQIEALSSPYLGSASSTMRNQQQPAQGERNCIIPEDLGQDSEDKPKDLKSRGLCLVPVSCTQHVGHDIGGGADYWAPAIGGGFYSGD